MRFLLGLTSRITELLSCSKDMPSNQCSNQLAEPLASTQINSKLYDRQFKVPLLLEDFIEKSIWDGVINQLERTRSEPCVFCGDIKPNKADRSLEHIQPKAHKGSDSWRNYASSCRICNNTRGTIPAMVYLVQRGRMH